MQEVEFVMNGRKKKKLRKGIIVILVRNEHFWLGKEQNSSCNHKCYP